MTTPAPAFTVRQFAKSLQDPRQTSFRINVSSASTGYSFGATLVASNVLLPNDPVTLTVKPGTIACKLTINFSTTGDRTVYYAAAVVFVPNAAAAPTAASFGTTAAGFPSGCNTLATSGVMAPLSSGFLIVSTPPVVALANAYNSQETFITFPGPQNSPTQAYWDVYVCSFTSTSAAWTVCVDVNLGVVPI
jgi:hypothetical protein